MGWATSEQYKYGCNKAELQQCRKPVTFSESRARSVIAPCVHSKRRDGEGLLRGKVAKVAGEKLMSSQFILHDKSRKAYQPPTSLRAMALCRG